MISRALLGAVGAALLVTAVSAQGRTASNKELEARANELESRLATIERSAANLVPMQQQIESARSELRALRGQIEEARHELDTLRQQQRDLYADLDRRLLLLENGAVPVQAGAGGGSSEEQIRAEDETAVYGDAFAALKAGRYEDAARGFQLYLAKYPQGPRADNATYWLGESLYVQKDYTAALRAFMDVLEKFPDSAKSADAMLKVGFSQYELKAFRNARATLEKVVASYPGTDADRLARERLARMDVERR
jgi:tol-pal system protein YbgF